MEPRESSEYQKFISNDDDENVIYPGRTGGTSDGSKPKVSFYKFSVYEIEGA